MEMTQRVKINMKIEKRGTLLVGFQLLTLQYDLFPALHTEILENI